MGAVLGVPKLVCIPNVILETVYILSFYKAWNILIVFQTTFNMFLRKWKDVSKKHVFEMLPV